MRRDETVSLGLRIETWQEGESRREGIKIDQDQQTVLGLQDELLWACLWTPEVKMMEMKKKDKIGQEFFVGCLSPDCLPNHPVS